MNKPGAAQATVHVKRSGDSVTVDPWRLRLKRDEEVQWVLEGSEDEMTVTPKPNGLPWPFDGGPPKGGKNRPAESGKMRSDAAEGTYRYNIELGSGPDALKIDPEMIIPRRK